MNQYSEDEVKQQLTPYHDRIRDVVERGYADWVQIKKFMAKNSIGPVLYPRTVANFVFDAVVQHALIEFAEDEGVRVKKEAQTVKFCFDDVVLARFKKGDEDNLGQNQPTQAVINFVEAQNIFPGLPPSAAKVKFLFSADAIEGGIDRVVVAARDGDTLLWHYDLDDIAESNGTVPFPTPIAPIEDIEKIVSLRNRKGDADENESS